mmetsp:Transcript_26831/g.77578  ORF Transcript_26831/g.77578 Transcript_26831/m.77578 type:complete len:447 (+) Transcript_26831:54-1394(+)
MPCRSIVCHGGLVHRRLTAALTLILQAVSLIDGDARRIDSSFIEGRRWIAPQTASVPMLLSVLRPPFSGTFQPFAFDTRALAHDQLALPTAHDPAPLDRPGNNGQEEPNAKLRDQKGNKVSNRLIRHLFECSDNPYFTKRQRPLDPVPASWPFMWHFELFGVRRVSQSSRRVLYRAITQWPVEDLPVGSVVIVHQFVMDGLSVKRSMRTAAIMQRFSGGDFVRVLRSTLEQQWLPGSPFLLMTEAMDGTLQDQVIDKNMDQVALTIRIRLLLQLLRGIKRMHAEGFVHRDLRPANLFVHGDCGGPDPSVCRLQIGGQDYSYATADSGADWRFQVAARRYTVKTATQEYAPPETRGADAREFGLDEIDAYDVRAADSYACGVIICEVLFGGRPADDLPWAGESSAAERRLRTLITGLTWEDPGRRLTVDQALDMLTATAKEQGWHTP